MGCLCGSYNIAHMAIAEPCEVRFFFMGTDGYIFNKY